MNKWIKSTGIALFLSGSVTGIASALPMTAPGTMDIFQQTGCSGIVLDENGEAIIGASVTIKGSAKGTITDMDGHFKLPNIKQGETVRVSYIGYEPQDVVWNGQSLKISMKSSAKSLDEVVVTALGIKREKKALGYSMAEIDGSTLTATRDANVANQLAGKVSGVQIKQNGTGVGGSSRIVIRGNNSISGNNQPLVVVDGVPIDNFSGGTDNYWGNEGLDKGSGLSDISPDDIESMSVLKGPAAAALYGSRAGNGVIMITTKKGSKGKGLGINFNTNLTFESPMQKPEFQNTYGQGSKGVYGYSTSDDGGSSWGPVMDGSEVQMALGKYPYAARGNDLYKDFLRTGTTWTNSLDITKASDDMTFRAGVTRFDNKGVVPNSGMDRTSVNLRATAKLAKWMSVDMKVNYINQHTNNRTKLAADPDNIFYYYLTMPRSIAFSDYAPYAANNWKREDGKPAGFLETPNNTANNPYWSAYRNTNKDRKDRLIGFAAMDFTLAPWLSLKLRSGIDTYSIQYQWILATGTPFWDQDGHFNTSSEKFTEMNSDFLITAKGNWNKFGIVGTAGGNLMYRSSQVTGAQSGALVIKDFYSISNGQKHDGTYTLSRKQINSLYATASLSWDNWAYLDLSARNDWSSTLPKENNSYFYPSVGASFIFTQMLTNMGKNIGPLTFGKIRASWAQVGNDTDPYQILNYYTLNYDIKGGSFTASPKDYLANMNLKNETIESWELGLELKAFNNRFGVDLAYYRKNAKDQILKVDIPSSTGYKQKMINAGNIQNEGWELSVTGTPILTKDFQWDTQFNWSKNKNKVVSLADGTDEQILSDASVGFLKIVAHVGGAYGDIYGYDYLRDDAGNLIIGDDGTPQKTTDYVKLGNNQPKWMAGWNNTFTYKNWSLGFMVDMRYGGDVFMGSIKAGATAGTLKITENREDVVVPGVTKDGKPNTKAISAESYWSALSGITKAWMYDATNVRLRELSLGYSFPKSLLKRTPITNLKLSLVARNVWMIKSHTLGFDPEAAFTSGNAQGIEFGSMPTMRSFGFNLNVSF